MTIYKSIVTNIQIVLTDYLPAEHSAVCSRITELTTELEERNAYKAYLEALAEASEIHLDPSGLGREDRVPVEAVPPKASGAQYDGSNTAKWGKQRDSRENFFSDREGVLG